ncbi:MAG: response regulator [Armatimonadia bacterium]|jgi:CheY-like chemotaxis protein|nr:response regulator [Armatimonadia bacterium]
MKRVLIVEDAANYRRWLRGQVSRLVGPAEVTMAETGESAGAAFVPGETDLVLLDLGLPSDDSDPLPRVETGLELLTRMRSADPKAVIVVLTSHRELEETCTRAGCDSFLGKGDAALAEGLAAALA